MSTYPLSKWFGIATAITLFIALVISLFVASDALESNTRFGDLYVILLIVNGMALVALGSLIAVNLRSLFRQVFRRKAGVRLTTNLTLLLLALTITPVTLVYFFSLKFLQQRLDNWFNVNVKETLQISLSLSRVALDIRFRQALRQIRVIKAEIGAYTDAETVSRLNEKLELTGAYQLAIFSSEAILLGAAHLEPETNQVTILTDMMRNPRWLLLIKESVFDDDLNINIDETQKTELSETYLTTREKYKAIDLLKLSQQENISSVNNSDDNFSLTKPIQGIDLVGISRDNYSTLEYVNDKVYVSVLIQYQNKDNQKRFLHAFYNTSEVMHELTKQVETAHTQYRERAYLEEPLKTSLALILSMVLLISLLSVIWLGFFFARRFVTPLSHLLEGTRAVARGDYSRQLPVIRLDEMGFLVQSFNEMTRRIAQARDQVKHSEQLAERQRAYLQAVLGRLSSGVIALDDAQQLIIVNLSASQVLNVPLHEMLGQSVNDIQEIHSALQPLFQVIQKHLIDNTLDWREETVVFGANGRRVLICRGTRLKIQLDDFTHSSYVIVFDDVTNLIQAQRDAAWSEVARRLAHEIKNPLTPIQLSAERLRQKYLTKLPEQEAQTLDRLTYTIIQQVEAMKEMVNTFSDYAKSPNIRLESLNLNQLIYEVTELYQHKQVTLNLALAESLPNIEADPRLLRQVIHNLTKNALEATLDAGKEEVCIKITTNHLAEASYQCVELRIQDQGNGFPPEIMDKVFEPYVTTKTKGTGLGLAIVKKIVEEHGGMVWVENIPSGCVIIRFPIPVSPEPVALSLPLDTPHENSLSV